MICFPTNTMRSSHWRTKCCNITYGKIILWTVCNFRLFDWNFLYKTMTKETALSQTRIKTSIEHKSKNDFQFKTTIRRRIRITDSWKQTVNKANWRKLPPVTFKLLRRNPWISRLDKGLWFIVRQYHTFLVSKYGKSFTIQTQMNCISKPHKTWLSKNRKS